MPSLLVMAEGDFMSERARPARTVSSEFFFVLFVLLYPSSFGSSGSVRGSVHRPRFFPEYAEGRLADQLPRRLMFAGSRWGGSFAVPRFRQRKLYQ